MPWADRVTYSISGVEVGSFTPGPAVFVELDGCLPGTTQVEGRDCPVSPLITVAESGTPSVEGHPPSRVGCNTFVTPEVSSALSTTVIRPLVDQRDCFGDFAVTLYLNDADDVEWIDLALSGP